MKRLPQNSASAFSSCDKYEYGLVQITYQTNHSIFDIHILPGDSSSSIQRVSNDCTNIRSSNEIIRGKNIGILRLQLATITGVRATHTSLLLLVISGHSENYPVL
jgi:hypothetical protein